MKLNLGCGDKILEGYLNIDLKNPKADKICDATNLSFIENNSIDEVLAIAVLEHISPYKCTETLKEWHRVLKLNGRLIVEVPDILEICKHFEAADKAERYKLINCIFGSTSWSINNPHLFGWYDEILIDHFHWAGFKNVIKAEPQGGHWGYMLRIEGEK
jgi:SAM-dependent methyltransferase